jgi:hypothetical protein
MPPVTFADEELALRARAGERPAFWDYFGRKRPNPGLPYEARVEFARAASFGVKALGVAGGALALGYAGTHVATSFGTVLHGQPIAIQDRLHTDATGTHSLNPQTGQIDFTPSVEYLKQLEALGYGPGGLPLPIGKTETQGTDPGAQKAGAVASAFSSPWTILALAGGVALVLYFVRRK